jgi:hypothetical protein
VKSKEVLHSRCSGCHKSFVGGEEERITKREEKYLEIEQALNVQPVTLGGKSKLDKNTFQC